jgi:glycosyltransferase involved in cell wall biosynthesis
MSMNDGEILVSINCITYNHERFIKQAIESFLMQKTRFDFEVLVHDDASTDKTIEIIRSYAQKYPKIIKPMYQKENQYSKGKKMFLFNHNRALGKYVAICEGDDYWTDPYKLQEQVDYMEKNTECNLVAHAIRIIDNDKPTEKVIAPYSEDRELEFSSVIYDGGIIGTSSIMYRKKAFDNPPDFYFCAPVEDYPLQVYLCENKKAFYINKIMSAYRTNIEGSWTDNIYYKGSIEKKIELNKKLICFLEKANAFYSYKYDCYIKSAVKKRNFYILKVRNDLKTMRNKEYICMYKDLPFKERFRIYLKHFFPKLYSLIKIIIQKTRHTHLFSR